MRNFRESPIGEVRRILLPRTRVNKGYVSWSPMRRLRAHARGLMLHVTKAKRVEAEKHAPYSGTWVARTGSPFFGALSGRNHSET
jgi:hypothetical protein